MSSTMPEPVHSDGTTTRIPSWVTLDINPDDPSDIGGAGPCLSLTSDKCAFTTTWSERDGAVAYIDAVRTGSALTSYELRRIALWAMQAADILDSEQGERLAAQAAEVLATPSPRTPLDEVSAANREAAMSAARHFSHLRSASAVSA